MAQKRPRQAAYHGASERRVPSWLLLVGGFLAGAVFSVFVPWQNALPFLKQPAKPVPNPTATAPAETDAGVAPDAAPARPKYDFYTVLPELDQVIPDAELIEQAAAPPPPPSAPATAPGRYFLQAGSFRDTADAETMKAKLALSGMRAGVTSVNINGETWFRVRVGPYDNAQDLDGARRQLGADGIQAIALKEAAPP